MKHYLFLTFLKGLIFMSLITAQQGCRQDDQSKIESLDSTDKKTTVKDYKPEFKGLEITGKTASGSADEGIENQFRYYIKKCDDDSWTFKKVLFKVRQHFEKTGKAVRIVAFPEHPGVIYTPGDLGQFLIDIGDLQVLPDPIRGGNGKFTPIPSTPPWAITICAFLGHEIEEVLADLEAKKRDWDNHHFKIANPTEDAIVKDYFGASRKRGRDCWEEHNDHRDNVLEFDVGLIRWHRTPARVEFSPNDGKPVYHVDPGRLGYITYEVGAKFPGVAAKGRCAKQP